MAGVYNKLPTSSEHGTQGSSGSLSGPSQAQTEECEGGVSIFVMFKEKKVAVVVANLESPLLELKKTIERATDVPVNQQRLVRGGKMLKELQKTLAELELTNECTIHLFPIPQAIATPISGSQEARNVTGVADSGEGEIISREHQSGALLPHHVETPQFRVVRGENPHENPWFQNTCREVQMWSMILMVLSFFTLFNNLNLFLATGEYGETPLDKCVFILDTCVSLGGLYVGRVGMVASRTLNREDVRKYCVNLGFLTLAAIVMRLMWAFDIVAQIKKAVHKSEAEAAAKGSEDSGDSDDPNKPGDVPLNEDMISTVSMQAAIIAMIIICAWAQCFARAVRLRFALQIHERVNTAESDEDLGADIEAIIVNPVQSSANNNRDSNSSGLRGEAVTAMAVPAGETSV